MFEWAWWYLVNKHVIEVIREAASKGVSQLSEQELLLGHGHQFIMAYKQKIKALQFDYFFFFFLRKSTS